MNRSAQILTEAAGGRIDLAVILGSGLAAASEVFDCYRRLSFDTLPDFPQPAVAGHEGEVALCRVGRLNLALIRGRVHFYEKGDPSAMAPLLSALQEAGVTTLIVTNAAGGVGKDFGPGSLALISDHISFSGKNPLIGVSPVDFVDLTDAYDPKLREHVRDCARALGQRVPEGVYMWFSGPSFETPAEIKAARTLGADLVGMSTVPEAIIARSKNMRVIALSAVVNWAAGMSDADLSHEQTQTVAKTIVQRFVTLLKRVLETWPDDPPNEQTRDGQAA